MPWGFWQWRLAPVLQIFVYISSQLTSHSFSDPSSPHQSLCKLGNSPAIPLLWSNFHCLDYSLSEGRASFDSQLKLDAVKEHRRTGKRPKTHKRKNASSSPTTETRNKQKSRDNAKKEAKSNFVSFEEWRRATLENEGQNPKDHKSRTKIRVNSERQGQSMDSIDTEGDIANVFEESGDNFVISRYDKPLYDPVKSDNGAVGQKGQNGKFAKDMQKKALSELKERFNYASFDCAALILKANSEARHANAILSENKDQYMLNKCSAKRFVVVELCNDILIDTIVLGNFEFFSSTFKDIKVSVSSEYPPKAEQAWVELGKYRASNTREMQIFRVENPLRWTRYLRIDFETHYGHQVFCPVSLLRVHGTNMLEDYRQKEQQHEREMRNARQNATGKTSQERSRDEIAANASATSKSSGVTQKMQSVRGTPHSNNSTSSVLGSQPPANTMSCPIKRPAWEYDVCGLHDHPDEIMARLRIIPDNAAVVPAICWLDRCFRYPVHSEFVDNHKTSRNDSNDIPRATSLQPVETANNEEQPAMPVEVPPVEQPNSAKQNEANVAALDPTSQEQIPIVPLTVFTPESDSQEPDTRSVYQKFMSRLNKLESDAGIRGLYMEQQSKMLKDILSKIQIQQTQMFIFVNQLNETVLSLLKSKQEVGIILDTVAQRLHKHDQMIDMLISQTVSLYRTLILITVLAVLWLGVLSIMFFGIVRGWQIPSWIYDYLHASWHDVRVFCRNTIQKRLEKGFAITLNDVQPSPPPSPVSAPELLPKPLRPMGPTRSLTHPLAYNVAEVLPPPRPLTPPPERFSDTDNAENSE